MVCTALAWPSSAASSKLISAGGRVEAWRVVLAVFFLAAPRLEFLWRTKEMRWWEMRVETCKTGGSLMTEDSLSVTWQASNNNKGPYKFLFSVAFLSVIMAWGGYFNRPPGTEVWSSTSFHEFRVVARPYHRLSHRSIPFSAVG